MRKQTKKWSMLTAAVLLTLSSLSFSQPVQAATLVSGTAANQSTTEEATGANPRYYYTGRPVPSPTAVGEGAYSENNAAALGARSKASKEYSTAIGASAQATAAHTVVVGSCSTAMKAGATSLGADVMRTGTNATAVGYAASATSEGAAALGKGAKATGKNAVALGLGSVADVDNTVSVGSAKTIDSNGQDVAEVTRRIVHVADGKDNSDAATYGQIAAKKQTVKLSRENNKIVSNDGDTIATFQTMSEVAANDDGFVSGANLYAETRAGITADSTNYISQASTAGANLSALDAAIGKVTKDGTFIKKYKTTVSDQENPNESKTVYTSLADNLVNLDTGISKLISNQRWYNVATSESSDDSETLYIGSGIGSGVENVSFYGYDYDGSEGKTRKLTGITKGDAKNNAAIWDQIAKEGQTVSLSTDARDEANTGKKNEIVSNDGTVLATFEGGSVAENDTGFVSGGTVYDAIEDAKTAMTYTGSDTISIVEEIDQETSSTKNVLHVKNMAMSTIEDEADQKLETTAYGRGSFAIGAGSSVGSSADDVAEYAMALGYKARAANSSAISLGAYSSAQGNNSIAIGAGHANYKDGGASALGSCAIAIGGYSTASKTAAIALGNGANAEGAGSVAIGAGSRATEDNTISVGSGVDSPDTDVATRRIVNVSNGEKNTDAATFGQIAKKEQNVSLSTGKNTIVSNDGTILATFEVGEVAEGNTGFVSGGAVHEAIKKAKTEIGGDVTQLKADIAAEVKTENGSYVKEENKVGGNLKALDEAIGVVESDGNVIKKSLDDKGNVTSVSQNLKNIDDKIGKLDSSKDAEGYQYIKSTNTISQNLEALDSITKGSAADLTHVQNVTKETYAKADGKNAIALGENSNAGGSNAISFGTNAAALKDNALAFGNTATASEANTMAFGNKAAASAEGASALGNGATASGTDSISFGTSAEAEGENSLAIGVSAFSKGKQSTSIGYSNSAEGDHSLSVGSLNFVTEAKANALGYNNIVSGKESSAIGTSNLIYGKQSVAIGYGNQVGDDMNWGRNALNGDDDNNTISGNNTYVFGANNIVMANNALVFGSNVSSVVDNAIAIGNSASVTGQNSVAIGNGSVAAEDNVVSVGAAGSERRITNVAAGINDTDAVNVGQLNQGLNDLHNTLTHEVNKVAAGSAALAALRPEGYDPNDKFSMAVGFGHYRNANAGAIGAFYKPNYDTTISIGATMGDGEPLMNMGVSFKLGSGSKKAGYQTSAALSQEVASLRKSNDKLSQDNQALKKDNQSQAKEIADLKADNEKIKADNAKMKEQIAMILAKMEMSDTVEKSIVK